MNAGRIAAAACMMTVAVACGSFLDGGGPAPAPMMPWTVTFFDGDGETVICAGTLIAPRWVLTAAHCISDGGIDTSNTACIGDARADCAASFPVAATFVHPDFRKPGAAPNDSDIALVQLGGTAAATRLPALADVDPAADTPVTFAGRGRDESGQDTPVLNSVQLDLQDAAVCQSAFGATFTSNMQCAGSPAEMGEKGICGGDSGGPVLVANGSNWSLVGVSSFGGCDEAPSVFTRVVPFRDWVRKTMAGSTRAASRR